MASESSSSSSSSSSLSIISCYSVVNDGPPSLMLRLVDDSSFANFCIYWVIEIIFTSSYFFCCCSLCEVCFEMFLSLKSLIVALCVVNFSILAWFITFCTFGARRSLSAYLCKSCLCLIARYFCPPPGVFYWINGAP